MIVRRYLSAVAALSVFAVLATILTAPLRTAHAQTPPTRFFGALTVAGNPAPAGTEVVAHIGGVDGMECGRVITSEEGRYVVDVTSYSTQEGCGNDEDTVFFVVGGTVAEMTGTFDTGHFVQLDLSVPEAAPPTEPPPPPPSEESPPPPSEENPPPPEESPPPAEEPPAE